MNWNQPVFWGITRRQLAGLFLFYGLSALSYTAAISISELQWTKNSFGAVFTGYLSRGLLDYAVKLLFTAPVWYVVIYRLRQHPLWQRLSLHLLLLPLFVLGWQATYYLLSETLSLGHLVSTARIWDTYITTLFYLVQFGIFHAFAYYQHYQRQRLREVELRELTLKSELSALKAQLNPHFLYNVFNTISASVPPELEHTREMLAELSDLFRYQLRASKSEWVTVADEIGFVKKYIALEQARFGDRLRVDFRVADDVLSARMPPMLLQPLVENSVKHGISPLIDGGSVCVSIDRRHQQLHISVADTGVGLRQPAMPLPTDALTGDTPGTGVGLANTRLRLEKMYGTTLHLTPTHPDSPTQPGLTIQFAISV